MLVLNHLRLCLKIPLAFFGGFSGSEIKHVIILTVCILYLIISIYGDFKYVYNFADSASSSRDRKIFFIGIILLIVAAIVFF